MLTYRRVIFNFIYLNPVLLKVFYLVMGFHKKEGKKKGRREGESEEEKEECLNQVRLGISEFNKL